MNYNDAFNAKKLNSLYSNNKNIQDDYLENNHDISNNFNDNSVYRSNQVRIKRIKLW